MLPAVRTAVRGLDAGLPFSNVATIDELVDRSLACALPARRAVGVQHAIVLRDE